MAKKANDSAAAAGAAGQVMKSKRAARRAVERLKKKAKPLYVTRVLILYSDSDSVTTKFMKSALGVKRAATTMSCKMRTTFVALEEFARQGRWGRVDPVNLTFHQFWSFIQSRTKKVSARTVQNEASHIRRSLRCVGRGEFAAVTCSSERLGVPSATRIGTGTAVHKDVLETALANARADTAAILLLEHALGLRHREVVQISKDTLRNWKRSISSGQPIFVPKKGPKGGRPRFIVLCPAKALEAEAAIDAALKVLENQEFLVDSVNLKAAQAANQKRMKKLGIADDDSQHSLRRSFAVQQYDYYVGELQMSEREAWSTLAIDLGHGDGRGRWVFNNYLKATLEQREAALAAMAQNAAKQEDDEA